MCKYLIITEIIHYRCRENAAAIGTPCTYFIFYTIKKNTYTCYSITITIMLANTQYKTDCGARARDYFIVNDNKLFAHWQQLFRDNGFLFFFFVYRRQLPHTRIITNSPCVEKLYIACRHCAGTPLGHRLDDKSNNSINRSRSICFFFPPAIFHSLRKKK